MRKIGSILSVLPCKLNSIKISWIWSCICCIHKIKSSCLSWVDLSTPYFETHQPWWMKEGRTTRKALKCWALSNAVQSFCAWLKLSAQLWIWLPYLSPSLFPVGIFWFPVSWDSLFNNSLISNSSLPWAPKWSVLIAVTFVWSWLHLQTLLGYLKCQALSQLW